MTQASEPSRLDRIEVALENLIQAQFRTQTQIDQLVQTQGETAELQQILTRQMLADREEWREQKAVLIALFEGIQAALNRWIDSHLSGNGYD